MADQDNRPNARTDPDLSHLSDEDRAALNRALQDYHRAAREEFEVVQADRDDAMQIEDVKELLKLEVKYAAKQMIWLAKNAHSESVRLNALKWIHTEYFRLVAVESGDDPVSKLFKDLAKNDKKPQPDHS